MFAFSREKECLIKGRRPRDTTAELFQEVSKRNRGAEERKLISVAIEDYRKKDERVDEKADFEENLELFIRKPVQLEKRKINESLGETECAEEARFNGGQKEGGGQCGGPVANQHL